MYRIQTLKDNTAVYASTGAAIGSVVPGVGTAIGAAVGSFIPIFTSLFGSPDSVANNNFVDSIVKSAQAQGIVGLTHEDVVHLLPGNWGANQSAALQQFEPYIEIIKGNGLGLNNISIKPGQDAEYILNFGGGYQPGHAIYYNPGSVQSVVNSGTGLPGGVQINTAGFTSSIPKIIIIGIFIVFLFSQGKK